MSGKISRTIKGSRRLVVWVVIGVALSTVGLRSAFAGGAKVAIWHLLPLTPSLQDTTPKRETQKQANPLTDSTLQSMKSMVVPDTTSSALKVVKTEPTEEASESYSQGMQHRKAGEFQNAAASFEAALRADPHNVKTLVNLARTYIDLEILEKANETINQTLAADSANADAYLVRGRIMNLKGDEQLAIDSYQKAIALDPDNAHAKNNLALIHIQNERFNEALPLLEQVIAQKNDVAYFHNNLGIVYDGLGEHRRAIDAFQAALNIDPDYEKARGNLERAQKALGENRPQEASSL